MSRILIDNKTGEVLKEFNENEFVISYDSKKIEYKKLKRGNFYKLSCNSIKFFISKEIKNNIKITFFKLIKMLDLNKGEFLMLDGCYANIKAISKELEMNRRTLYNHLKVLEKYQILKKIKHGRNNNIAMNPYFIWYGKNVTDDFVIFKDSMWVTPYKKVSYKNIIKK